MPIIITPELLASYAGKQTVHAAYKVSSEMYKALEVHANGDMPYELINCRRPSESSAIQKYREDIYQPMTKSSFTKVVSSLAKIRRSPDWSVKFPDKKISTIAEDETLEKYISEKYPFSFVSLVNWIFSVGIKNYLLDANAVIMVRPINVDKTDDSVIYKPFPFIFNSPYVLDYVEEDYAVLLSENTCTYNNVDAAGTFIGQQHDGVIIHIVTSEYIATYHQTNAAKRMVVHKVYDHNLGYMPAFKMPGAFFKTCGDSFINESRIAGMLADMNEAVREYSDLQAEIVQHVHSEKWIYQNLDCDNCNGSGKEQINLEKIGRCHVCEGRGKVPTSPYNNIVLRPPEIGDLAVPTPPAGYIQKTDVALMVTKLNEMFYEKLYNALASINMQFLSTVPQAQSGIAKEVDKDELNNFVHSIAEDLVYLMDKICAITADQRYSVVVPDAEKRAELLPDIAVPAVFDLLSSSYLVEEIKTAKESNVNTLIVIALEAEFAAKKFYNNPEIAQLLNLILNLDPMPGISDDQKALRLQNDGVTQEDYIISCNIVPFVKRAIIDNSKFSALPYADQMTVLTDFAKDKLPKTAEEITPAEIPEIPEIPEPVQ